MASSSIAFGRPWSADFQLIQEITILKRWFLDSGIREDIYAMQKALKYLLMVSKPKLDKYPSEVKLIHNRLTYVEDNLHQILFSTPDGKFVETDGTRNNKRVLIRHLEQTCSMLFEVLQRAGIYSRPIQERTEALGEFDG